MLKIVLSIGGGGKGSENFARMAGNAEARERFAHSARALVDEYGLDGIDSMSTPAFFCLSSVRDLLPSSILPADKPTFFLTS